MVATKVRREAYTFALFEQFDWLHCGVSTVGHGNMSYAVESREQVQPRREAFLRELGLTVPAQPPYVVAPVMEHGDVMVAVPEQGLNGIPRCDVLLTRGRSVLLQHLADCLGLVFVHPQKKIVALAHAGYKGVGLEVPRKTVEYFCLLYGVQPHELLVGMGPAAQGVDGQGSFMPFLGESLQSPDWKPWIDPEGEGYRVRWADRAEYQLVAAGILPEQIERSSVDTYSDRNFFSHSRWAGEGKNGPDGRHAIAVGMYG